MNDPRDNMTPVPDDEFKHLVESDRKWNEQQEKPRAFPCHEPCEPPECSGTIFHDGMLLRDYFAAAALNGYLSTENICGPETIAEMCFKYADEMLKARLK